MRKSYLPCGSLYKNTVELASDMQSRRLPSKHNVLEELKK